jgi:ABC-type Fe3+/spermidine/putrescine transport system ATPase subunit
MIALEKLSVTAGTFRLHGITLEAGDGEYLVLLGPSGAGKTMLLEVIAGLRAPDTGTVTLNHRDMAGVPPEHRGTSLVYQDYSLFPHMTVAGNIAYGLIRQKKPANEIRERVDALLAGFGITALKDRYPGSLSGGEQQRVALARALATNPSVLLLDEPFASLDPRNRDECVRVMLELKEARTVTILQVSHSGDEAYALADKVVVLIGGRVAQTGTPDEIFHRPISPEVAQFVGMENVLSGTVVRDGAGRSLVCIGSTLILLPSSCQEGARISVGIPAWCIRVSSVQPAAGAPGVNCVPCRVKRVLPGKETVTVLLEGAIPLTAVSGRSPADGQYPLAGEHVYAVFKDTDVRVLLTGPV